LKSSLEYWNSNIQLLFGVWFMLETRQSSYYLSTLVLVAALNEEKGIGPTLAELKQFLRHSKFLVIDGKSCDGTVHVAKSLGADVLCQEGTGKGNAIGFALEHINDEFEYVVFTDADYTYPGAFVPQMIQILDENPQLGMVCGNRFNSHLDIPAMHNAFYLGNRVLAFTHNLLNGIALRDPLTGLRVVRWDILKDWHPKSAGFDFEVELNHRVERQGYGIAEIEIPYRERIGVKKLKFRHGLTILRRIIAESLV
jgi:glycosyltransferase involved in cell wall biosynthesis